jgi:carboxypeptidase Taq
MQTALADLKERVGEIHDLDRASALLGWDQQVKMPPGGGGVRAEQLATIGRISHEALTSDEMGRLLNKLEPFEDTLEYDSDEASLIRVVRRDWEKARRVPAELRAEMSRAASLAMPVWVKARQDSDFSQFLPALRHNFDLRRRYVECFDDYDEPYDVLLDDFEPGMKTAEVRAVFDRLKQEQVPLAAAARAVGERPVRDLTFPLEGQQEFELKVIRRFGFDPSEWRLDTAVHPFASSIATTDIRLTTRYFDDNLDGLFGTMHECGHGLYEHGVARELERTPLASGASLALHESQSRMWENMVGRSLPFWRYFYPELQRTFPDALRNVAVEDLYSSVNWVEPSLIRVEADEATYNLHIILRFELEQELLADTIDLDELPEIWN